MKQSYRAEKGSSYTIQTDYYNNQIAVRQNYQVAIWRISIGDVPVFFLKKLVKYAGYSNPRP